MRKKSQDFAATVINMIWFGLILWGLFSFYSWADREGAKEYAVYQQETQSETEEYLSSTRSIDEPDPPDRNSYADASADLREMMATDAAAEAMAEFYLDPCPYTNTGSNLRAGPGTSYPIIGYAPKDSCIPIDGRNSAGTWYSFRDEDEFGPGVIAWIWAELVEDAPEALPVAPVSAVSDLNEGNYLTESATQAPDCAGGCTTYPTWCDPAIKGNVSYETGEKIYHVPGQEYYGATVINPGYGERWFCTEDEAQGAGWRKARR